MPAKTDETPDIEPIVVFDLIMPNGKRMRDCNSADMKKFGDLLLALQLPFPRVSESMGNHDSKIVDADSVD